MARQSVYARHRQDDKDLAASLRRRLRDHVCRPGDVRSFRFNNVNGGSAYWFDLTWTPGHLSLVGDLGEMTISHYHAMLEFEPAMQWIEGSGSDTTYLLSKTGVRADELDKDATYEQIIADANSAAIEARRGYQDEWRGDLRGLRKLHQEWAVDIEWWGYTREDEPPRLTDYVGNGRPDVYRDTFARQDVLALSYPGYGSERWRIPDGWDLWYKIWKYHGWGHHPDEILKPEGRREAATHLRNMIADMGRDQVAELCGELGYDDFYGIYRTPSRAIQQIQAIRTGVSMILDQLHPKRTWGNTWADPIV